MKKTLPENTDRRLLLKLLGGSAAFVSVAALTGCSDGGSESAATAKPAAPKAEPKAPAAAKPDSVEEMVDAASESMDEMADAAGESIDDMADAASESVEDMTDAVNESMDDLADAAESATQTGAPYLSEDNPQAKALGYRTDSSTVDGEKHPNHSADQACANCALFVGKAGDEWGPCGIFPGNQVNSGGWCSAYSRKA